MLRRKITDQLLLWKKQDGKKALIVQGARQVGKTFAIRAFGQANYERVLEINFKETPSAAEIFSGDLSIDALLTAIRFRYPDSPLTPGGTLLFLDEIQECPEAITSLKFWTLDGRYDVIASGSLLGIDCKRPSSYPVGYVEHLRMTGLDFEEYLWSRSFDAESVRFLRDCFQRRVPVPPSVHSEMMKHFRIYMALGGMPEVIQKYTDTQDFTVADRVQRDLLSGYLFDIAHYAAPDEKIKAEKCYLSLAKQLLGKDNHKFQYKEIEHGGRAYKYYSSLEWLNRADMTCLSHNVNRVAYELSDYEITDNFRVYPTDMSLLMAMRSFDLKQQIVENTLTGLTAGGIYESVIADQLYKKNLPLHFFRDEMHRKEVDFLIERNGQVIPVEVKSGNTVSGSLNQLMKANSDIPLAYKLANANIGQSDLRVVTIPQYMVMFL